MMVAIATAAFAAGFGAGLAAPAVASVLGEKRTETPAQRFVQTFIERFDEQFDLAPEQVRDLRAILLQNHNDEVSIATNAMRHQQPYEETQRELMQAQRRMDERIQWILDDNQRRLYRETISMQSGRPQEPSERKD